ncbi:hypothetical protein JTE90_026894 [Oedothorax gibbosus]|uniref:D-isomer specific 2-hydroxyacid dehydrogenase NAD-binding domain-containing protein n=1 Tax=Oedothorax gibbosus TaxID=931172 RepID=A0AAV6UDM6_9ARAC|nr:hypothetical protein JTE90_026894 [Oedothorax gibbosus]
MLFRNPFGVTKLLKMAQCFSSPSVVAVPKVFVLSKIPDLIEKLKLFALPGIQLKNIPILGTNIDEEDIDSLKEAEILVCDTDLLIKNYKNMPNLKWAHSTWAGVQSLFKAFAKEPSFTITRHGGDAFCGVMAEYVMCQILICERKFKLCWKNQQSKTWSNTNFSHRSLNQITVTILGAGNMGTAVANFLKLRGTTVLGFARKPRPLHKNDVFDKISNDLVEVIKDCDYLCNTLPSTPLTTGILNSSLLKNCQKSPVLINVGRGSLITEDELVHALQNGTLSGAVLDVFEQEPLPASSRLWDMPQVTITPHIATLSTAEHVAEEFFNSFSSYIDGHGLSNILDWSAGY